MGLASEIAKMVERALRDVRPDLSRAVNQLPGGSVAPATGSDRGTVALADANPAAIGAADPGAASDVSRSDHVHALPTTGVTPGVYGDVSAYPVVTVDAQGRITSAAEQALSGGPPSGAAGGDLGGSYPDPDVVALQGFAVHTATPDDGDVLTWIGANSRWEPAAPSGGGGGGAPTDASYLVEDAHAGLSAEVVLGTTVITTAAYASRQAAAKAGRVFLPTDAPYLERDTGAAWASWGPIRRLFPPPLSGWSWVNQDGGAISSGPVLDLTSSIATSGLNLNLRARSAPATPYSVEIDLVPHPNHAVNSGFGCGWRQSSDGKLAVLWSQYSNIGQTLISAKWDSPTSYNSAYLIGQAGIPHPVRVRLSDNGTTRTIAISYDGFVFVTWHAVSRTDFLTPDQLVFFVDSRSSSVPIILSVPSWREF